ncbi:DNA-packaging protein [Labrys monachus]|uniref:Phage terminase large subunit-like protein n=1 Tax=Labrys monachus TaxID=217067 RepID=A0ABU0FKP8_9HYPH|nr:terminase family protein [Labrys monachus]MDQ0395187.1 phage terminase large subunit-like protein [Labrys monachus]
MQTQRDGALFGRLADVLGNSWRMKARPEQIAPPGDWAVWALVAGRGFGKTRTGAEWVQEQVLMGAATRIALVAPTAADARDVMVEGESGLLAIAPKGMRPEYEPSRRRLTWPNGVIATTYSADEPERLRGPQFDAAWCDEVGSWRYLAAWDMLQFGLRLGDRPRAVVTTTPKPNRLLRELMKRAGEDVVITRGKTRDNAANLAAGFMKVITDRYAGTRLGRQELDGELLDDVPNCLWPFEVLERCRVDKTPQLIRVVVAVDPSGSNGEDGGDAQGIVVAGKGDDGKAYILADRTVKLSPDGWGKAVIAAFDQYKADKIVVEKNYGGEMCQHVIQTARKSAPIKLITATRGKAVRAEPVAALYEQGKVHHVVPIGSFDNPLADLEEEMRLTNTSGYQGPGSPNRMDALVWALTELMFGGHGPMIISDKLLELSRMPPAWRRAAG